MSLHIFPFTSNVLLLTHPFGNPTPNLDPTTPPPIPPPITTKLFHLSQQHYTPSDSPTPDSTNTINIQSQFLFNSKSLPNMSLFLTYPFLNKLYLHLLTIFNPLFQFFIFLFS